MKHLTQRPTSPQERREAIVQANARLPLLKALAQDERDAMLMFGECLGDAAPRPDGFWYVEGVDKTPRQDWLEAQRVPGFLIGCVCILILFCMCVPPLVGRYYRPARYVDVVRTGQPTLRQEVRNR